MTSEAVRSSQLSSTGRRGGPVDNEMRRLRDRDIVGRMAAPHKWAPRCAPPRDLVRPVPIDPTGRLGPTKAQAAGPRWRRTTLGLYVPSAVGDRRPEQRILEQSMRLPAGGAVTGWAACRLLGGNFFDGLMSDGFTMIPGPLAIGLWGQLAQTREASVSRDRLKQGETTRRAGIPCTIALRALFDAARSACEVREATVAIDMMAAAEVASIRQVREYLADLSRWRGLPQVRAALDLASERSRSPNETRMRLIWEIDAGLPRPLVNQPVFDLNGRLLGIADLFDPEAGVVGEFDGADHRKARRHSRDVAREDGFRGRGLEYFKVTGPDLADRQRVTERMTSTRSRAKWLTPDQRQWTLKRPPGWEEEWSLDELLEHRAWLASLYAEQDREGSQQLPFVS